MEKIIRAGQTVESKLMKNKIGTVLQTFSGDGHIEVRWDGEKQSFIIPVSRVKAAENITSGTIQFDPEEEDQEFQRGDYIEVRLRSGETVRGAALTDWVRFGYATFDILTQEGEFLTLNSNYDKHKVIFKADIARGLTPDF